MKKILLSISLIGLLAHSYAYPNTIQSNISNQTNDPLPQILFPSTSYELQQLLSNRPVTPVANSNNINNNNNNNKLNTVNNNSNNVNNQFDVYTTYSYNYNTTYNYESKLTTALNFPSGSVGINTNDSDLVTAQEITTRKNVIVINDFTSTTNLPPTFYQPPPTRAPQTPPAFQAPLAPYPSSVYIADRIDKDITSLEISRGILNLGQKIVQHLLENSREKSEVISPLSIAGVLYLLHLGAAKNTFKELSRLLEIGSDFNPVNAVKLHQQFGELINDAVNNADIPNEDKPYPEYETERVHNISIANGLFIRQDFRVRPYYQYAAEQCYRSEVRRMDFNRNSSAAQKYINNWVNEKTHGKIKSILDYPPRPSTEMVIVSALYFKALWWEEIGIEKVFKLPFYPQGLNNPSIDVETMVITADFMPYYESKEYDCTIVGMKYQRQLSTMYFIVPNGSTPEKLKKFQIFMNAERIDNLINNTTERRIPRLTIPKFHLENEVDLKAVFSSLGLYDLFNPRHSDLSVLSPAQSEPEVSFRPTTVERSLEELDKIRGSERLENPHLFVSKILHKVDLTVNERGTEGGAATAAFGDRIMGGLYVYINVPFMFVIRQDKTRLPLFYGSIFEPEQV